MKQLERFTKVKAYKRGIGKSCLHCGRSATVTAIRVKGRLKMPVRYCHEHADMRGATA